MLKQFFTWGSIILSVVLLIALFVFKDDLTGFSSQLMKSQVGSEIAKSEAQRIDSAYNYSKNGLPYQYTFLEFGATGCSACKRMKVVMSDIERDYPDKVNVRFLNVLLPENQKIMNYFGIVMIPTQVLLDRQGKEYFRHTGYFSTEDIKKKF